ncbi:hypothetical protein QFC22_000202 [Naganishia vaughanmartiniae]|uniref:Uncharacterized protein n=1 Tax=Naganishia vaughanmartiniae TaxID=1424756 RepID=A0ACC2XPR2_9TREE|nr:hypothetical protein QFC22_000202 [Naganishia vaughanmartiniae]
MNSDFTARITLDEWQEYQNLKANFHRYTDCYSQEQQTLLARIDHLQIENVSLHDKLLTQEQLSEIKPDRNAEDSGIQSDSVRRRLNRRASLFDGTWTNSLQSTMVSPYPPTVFSPSVSISRARKPTLAVTVPDRSPVCLSSPSEEQSKSCGAADGPKTSWTFSPSSSSTSLKPERRSSGHLPAVRPSLVPLDTFAEDEPFTNASWAEFEWDGDFDPPGTAVSAPAGLISSSAVRNVQYTMVLIDASNVKFVPELVEQGQTGGYSFIDNLHHTISSQLATHDLSPIADTFMIRMIVQEEEYGNLKNGNADPKQMEEFCLGIQSHMSSMPFEIVPNVRFSDSPSAVLSALRMCLGDEDCQRVFLAVDVSLPVYRDSLLNLSANSNTSKLLLLNGDSDAQNMDITCLDVRNVVSAISDSSGSIVLPSAAGSREDEARWIPPSYSDVAKAAPRFDYPGDNSASPSGHVDRSETIETWQPSSLSQAITVPHFPIVHAECALAASKRCLFDGNQFQGRGHQPNMASLLYGERTFKEESTAGRRPRGEANGKQ